VSTEAREWDRQPEESGPAFAAFRTFLELGCERTVVAAARQVGKSERLLRKWVSRHRWRDRAYVWDLAQARESEAAVAQEREATVRRQWQDADRAQKLSMAKVSSLVIRDPETGEPTLSSEVTVADAVRLYRLGLEIQRGQLSSTAPGDAAAADQSLETLSDPELQQVIKLARERAETEQSQEAHEDEQQTKTNAEGDDPD
jgi:hypothetical protein